MTARVSGAQYFSRTASLPPITAMSVCCWAAFNATPSGTWNEVIGAGNTSGTPHFGVGYHASMIGCGLFDGTSGANFPTQPLGGQAFFFALTNDATNIRGYSRRANRATLEAISIAGLGGTANSLRIGNSVFDGTDFFNGRVWNARAWDRVLTPAELLIESRSARPVFRRQLNFWWKLRHKTDTLDYSGNGRHATVTGTITTEDQAGQLRPRARRLWQIGIAAGGAPELDGDVSAQAAVSGALSTAIPIAGAQLVVANATGALSTGIRLAGAAANVVIAAGALTAQIRLNANAVVQALAAAGLSTGINLAASGQAAATATGALTTGGSGMAGAAQAEAAASGSLTVQIRLNGAAVAQALAQAGLTSGIRLAGAAQGAANASGALNTGVKLAGAASDTVTVTGALNAGSQFAAAANDTVTATGALSTGIRVSGAAQDVVSMLGALATAIPLLGAATVQTQASGNLTATGAGLAGAAAATVAGTGALTVALRFNGAALDEALASGALSTSIRLDVQALAQAAMIGEMMSHAEPVNDPRFHVGRRRRSYITRAAA